jgi:hypothetical protein
MLKSISLPLLSLARHWETCSFATSLDITTLTPERDVGPSRGEERGEFIAVKGAAAGEKW